MSLELLLSYGLQFVGIYYHFGGKTPLDGIDCSGLVSELLKAAGMLHWDDELNAQNLFDKFKSEGTILETPQAGALAFYGSSTSNVTHVVFCYGERVALGADGGSSGTLSKESAIMRQAFVKLRPVNYRSDLVGVILPKY